MAKNKELKVKKKWQELVSKITGGILFGLVALLIVFQFVGIFTSSRNGGVPNYGGFMSFRVKTDSMQVGNKFTVDTMVFIQDVNVDKLKKGDVITFTRKDATAYNDNRGDNLVITHRITDVEEFEGEPAFRTLGDNLNAMTCPAAGCTEANKDYVTADDIFGKVIGENKALGVLNKVMTEQPLVMVGLVLVPLLVVFSSSLVDLIKQLKNEEKEAPVTGWGAENIDHDFEAIKEQEKLKMLIEIEKEKMRRDVAQGKPLEPIVDRNQSEELSFEAIKEQEKLRLLVEIEKEKIRREMEEEHEKDKK